MLTNAIENKNTRRVYMKKQNKETSNIFSLTITEVEAIVRSIYQNCKPSKNRYNI